VYQVQAGDRKLARVPDLREYFSDLDFLLNVCSDGPAKSFAFRRLKYLASKWSLYCLLNEYQELADMKAVPHRCVAVLIVLIAVTFTMCARSTRISTIPRA
jgi:AMP deaminase